MSERETCDVCGGSGRLAVMNVVEITSYGNSARYAQPDELPCARCLGMGDLVEPS